jgi:hypothetical protein
MLSVWLTLICLFQWSQAKAKEAPEQLKLQEPSSPQKNTDKTPVHLSEPMSSEILWDEVMSTSENPRAYDWRRARWELEYGLDDIDERTVFRSEGFHLGIGVPMSNGVSIRAGFRRILVKGSRAGDLIEKTPYRQPAQPNRYELYGLVGYSIAEGRAFTRLSPLIGDCEHALSVEIGGHYTHPSPNALPQKDPVNSRVSGQLPVSSTWVAHLGVKYVLYIPNGLGLFISPGYEKPLAALEGPLDHWYTLSVGAVISFSDKPTITTSRSQKPNQEP